MLVMQFDPCEPGRPQGADCGVGPCEAPRSAPAHVGGPAMPILTEGHICPAILILLVVYLLGKHAVKDSPTLQEWGRRAAGAAFLARLGFLCFVALPVDIRTVLGYVLDALFVAGIVLGGAWACLPGLAILKRLLFAPWQWIQRPFNVLAKWRERGREAEHQRQAQADYDRRSPEREQARRDADERARAEAERKHLRRELIFACQREFDLHRYTVRGRLSEETFRQFLVEYLGSDQSATELRHNAELILNHIQGHLRQSNPVAQFRTPDDLYAWFAAEKAKLESAPISDDLKESYVAVLIQKFDELLRGMMFDRS